MSYNHHHPWIEHKFKHIQYLHCTPYISLDVTRKGRSSLNHRLPTKVFFGRVGCARNLKQKQYEIMNAKNKKKQILRFLWIGLYVHTKKKLMTLCTFSSQGFVFWLILLLWWWLQLRARTLASNDGCWDGGYGHCFVVVVSGLWHVTDAM